MDTMAKIHPSWTIYNTRSMKSKDQEFHVILLPNGKPIQMLILNLLS